MSYTVVKDRFPELRRAFSQFRSKSQQKTILRKFATFAGKRLSTMFLNVTPDGAKWIEPTYESPAGASIVHGRPSIRQHGMTLAKSWGDTEISDTYDGVSFLLGTHTAQMGILLTGAGEHPIPRSGQITFWHHKSGREMFFGGIGEFGFVNHPGFERLTALENIYRRHGKGLVKADFNRARRAIWSPLGKFYGAEKSF